MRWVKLLYQNHFKNSIFSGLPSAWSTVDSDGLFAEVHPPAEGVGDSSYAMVWMTSIPADPGVVLGPNVGTDGYKNIDWIDNDL